MMNPESQSRTVGGFPRTDGPSDTVADTVQAEQETPHRLAREVVESVVDFIKKEGVAYLSNLSTDVSGWARIVMNVGVILGYALTAAGHGMRRWNYDRLSRVLLKAGAITTSSSVILALAVPLPPAVAWSVGLVAWLIVAAVVVFS